MHLYTEIVHFYQKRKEYASVVKACKRYGEAEPQLWRSALTYFADQDPTECRAELMEVLANIDKRYFSFFFSFRLNIANIFLYLLSLFFSF